MILKPMKDRCIDDGRGLAIVTRLMNRIRRRTQNFDPKYLMDHCLTRLAQNDLASLDDFVRPFPWEILLFMKWLLTDSPLGSNNRQTYHDYDVRSLFELLIECYDGPSLPTNDNHWYIFFRKSAFQQFKFQRRFGRYHISRQSLLFSHLDLLHPIRQKFSELTGMELLNFVELSVFLVFIFLNESHVETSKASFHPFEKYYPDNTINRFFELISADTESIAAYLRELERRYAPRADHQLFELSPLRRFPILKNGEQYRPYCKRLLYISLQHWVYDFLRDYNAQWFVNEFGHVFERYVERLIRELGLPFLTERQIVSTLKGKRKRLIDFVIVDGASKIFVDAKGVEMSYLGQVSDNPDDIQRGTDSSIVKGIKQGCSVANSIRGIPMIDGIGLPAENENYLIVVTYKELYIGNGRVFRDLLGESGMVQLQRCDGFHLIPMEHMYFMSIDEFEIFVQAVHEKKIGFLECLRRAVTADSAWNTRKMLFSQHLQGEAWPDGIPEFLNYEFMEILTRMQKLHPDSPPGFGGLL